MKNRLLTYLILLPIILLLSMISIGEWLSYVTVAVLALCGVVVFIAYKRIKYLSKIKKGLVILLMALAILFSFGGETSFAMSDEELNECQERILKLTEIPEGLRTNDQNKELEKLIKEYNKEVKKRNKGDRACPTAKQMISNVLADCWLCDMVYVIVESMDKLASSFLNKVRDGEYAVMLMGLGLAFWLVMRVLGYIMTLGMGDVGSFITELFKRVLLVIILAFFIHMPVRKMVDLFITPVFTFSAALSSSIQAANTSKEGDDFSNILTRKAGVESFQCSYCKQLGPNASAVPDGQSKYAKYTNRVLENRAISPAFRNSLLCITCNVYALTAPASVLGDYMMCAGIEDFKPLLGPLDKITGWFTGIHIGFYNLQLYIVGLILYICFFVISAIFVFPLIENFFRIGFVIVLLPFLIAAYAFPSTRAYSKRGFQLLIYAMFVFLSISIFLTVLMGIFNSLFFGKADKVATMLVNNDANGLVGYFFFSPVPYGASIFYGSILLVFLAWQLSKSLDEFCLLLSGIDLNKSGGNDALSSAGGFNALQAAWGNAVGTHSVISSIYGASWAPTPIAESNMKKDARLRGANPYHSTESLAKGIESKTASTARRYEAKLKDAGERLGDKAESGISLLNQKMDGAIASGGRGLSAYLTRKGTELLSRSSDPNASKLSKATSSFMGNFLLGSRHVVNGVSKAGRFVNLVGGTALGMVANTGIRLLGSGLGVLTKSTGVWLSKNKYYNKTAALLRYKLPQKLKAFGADLVYTTTLAALGGISAYHKLAARLKGNKDTLNPEGPASGDTSKDTEEKEKKKPRFFIPFIFFGRSRRRTAEDIRRRKERKKFLDWLKLTMLGVSLRIKQPNLFKEKLSTNLEKMKQSYKDISELFNGAGISKFERLPDDPAQRARFESLFKEFSAHLNAASAQGFKWGKTEYEFGQGKGKPKFNISIEIDEKMYTVLRQRYAELHGGAPTPREKSEFEKNLERINIKAFKYYSKNTYRSERDSWLNRPIDGSFFTDAYNAIKKKIDE